MAGYQRVIFNGEAGERWKNDTGRVQYQLLASWDNTCGVCAQYDRAIGPAWPLPYHRNCRCRMVAVVPGGRAEPFVDFRAEAAKLDDSQQKALVGAANYRLIQSGEVAWNDVVTPYRVRPLREVVAIRKLSVETLTKAGVARPTAEKAWASVNSAEHQLVERHRAELVSSLEGAGLDRGTIAGLAAEGIASRVAIGGGPSGSGGFRETPVEDRLRRFLATWRLERATPPEPEKTPEPRTRIEAERKGDATEEEANQLVELLAETLPETLSRKLKEFGTKILHVGKLEDEKGEAVKETPRGWEEGTTWENCEAYYDPALKALVIAKTYVDKKTKKTVQSTDLKGSLFHENGHAIDHAFGYPSRKVEFLVAYRNDKVAAVKDEGAAKTFAYYLQDGLAGPSEAFAELSAFLFGHPSFADKRTLDYRKWFPNATAWLEKFYGLDEARDVVSEPVVRRRSPEGAL